MAGELQRKLQQRLAMIEPGATLELADAGMHMAPVPMRRSLPATIYRGDASQPQRLQYRPGVAQVLEQSVTMQQPQQQPVTMQVVQQQQPQPQNSQPQMQQSLPQQAVAASFRVVPPPPRTLSGMQNLQIPLSGSTGEAQMGSRTPLSSFVHPGLCGASHQIPMTLSRQVSTLDISSVSADDHPKVPILQLPVRGLDMNQPVGRHTIGGCPLHQQQPRPNGEAMNSARGAGNINVSGSKQLYEELAHSRSEKNRLMDENHQLREKARVQQLAHRELQKARDDEDRMRAEALKSRIEQLERDNALYSRRCRERTELGERHLMLQQTLEHQISSAEDVQSQETARQPQEDDVNEELREIRSIEAALGHKQLEFQQKFKDLESWLVSSRRENDELHSEMKAVRLELARRTSQVEEAQQLNVSLGHQLDLERKQLKDERRRSEEQGRRWAEESAGVGAGTGEAAVRRPPPSPGHERCSESALRAALTEQTASPLRLKQAIESVEALLSEARRELATKQLRERRAAYEQLHSAMEAGREDELMKAINFARSTEVDEEELSKANAQLMELQSESEAVKAAKAARAMENECKKNAFQCVKKDDKVGLARCIENVEAGANWKEWRDYMGRNLWRFALEMRARHVQEYLRPLMGLESNREQVSPQTSSGKIVSPFSSSLRRAPSEMVEEDTASVHSEATIPPADPEAEVGSSIREATSVLSRSSLPQDKIETLKREAFRCVVQDNMTGLSEVLDRLALDDWSGWENKGGKDLLTLSQERGSSGAYSVLAKRLGLVQDRKRELFEERESVWVFLPGEVQPKRATVLEDTPEESEYVLLEYWDGDDPPCKIEKCMVRKMWA